MGPTNLCVPYFYPGNRRTFYATGDIRGKTFVFISERTEAGFDGTENPHVATATAGGLSSGVAVYDVPRFGDVPVHCTPGAVVPVTTGEAITAGHGIQVGANGLAVRHVDRQLVGWAEDDADAGADCPIRLA